MTYRPRISRYTREQWQLQRDRFAIDAETPTPIIDPGAHTLRDPVNKLMKSLGLESSTVQQKLMNNWQDLTGNPLCRHARPGPLERGQLIVYVSNAPMLMELSRFQGPTLLKNIQAVTGTTAVKKLRFLIDPDTRPSS